MDFERVYLSAHRAVVGIRASDGTDSGFFVDHQGIEATCHHVVAGERDFVVRLHDSREVEGRARLVAEGDGKGRELPIRRASDLEGFRSLLEVLPI